MRIASRPDAIFVFGDSINSFLFVFLLSFCISRNSLASARLASNLFSDKCQAPSLTSVLGKKGRFSGLSDMCFVHALFDAVAQARDLKVSSAKTMPNRIKIPLELKQRRLRLPTK